MVNLSEIKNNIMKVTLGLNVIFLIIAIFFTSKAFIISAIVINILFNGTLIMMARFGNVFDSRTGPLGNLLGAVGGQLDSLMKKEDDNGQIQR